MKLFYAFHYSNGLNTTYASNTSMTAGSVVAYATKQLRDESCNEIKSSFLHFNTKKRPIRAVTRAEIKSMGHKESLIKTSDVGWIVSTHVIGHNMSMQEYTEMLGN